jgi:hypothetical protein
MMFFHHRAALLGIFACSAISADLVRADDLAQAPRVPSFLDQHCIECHDDVSTKGGLNLLELAYDPGDPHNLAIWAKVHDRAKSGEMPPAKKPRPEADLLAGFTAKMAEPLEKTWKERYENQGRVGGRRLNPTAYEHTLRNLLAAPWLELKEMLPPDPSVEGFDNVAEAQEISYVQLSRYLDAAEVAIDGAVQLRPHHQPEKVRTWFSQEGRYLGKGEFEGKGTGDIRPVGDWTIFFRQPNSAQDTYHIKNNSPRIPGWYRFRVRCKSFQYEYRKFLNQYEIDCEASEYLKALDVFREKMTIFSGVSHPQVDGGHSAEKCFLTAAPHPGRDGFRNSISVDQYAANRIGHLTRFPSLAIDVATKQSLSFTQSGVQIPGEDSPSKLYRKVFVQGSPTEVEAQVAKLRQGRSFLDQTSVIYGTCMGNAHAHTNNNLPVLIAGGGFRHSQHISLGGTHDYPLPNLFVSVLQQLGIES